jgi:hypothetical protein
MRFAPFAVLIALALTGSVLAKLPAQSDEAKAKTAEAAAKSAWSDKIGAYKLCQAMDRVADGYRKEAMAAGKEASAPTATPVCADPGPFAITPVAAKPIEASGAHSPPDMAVGPPGTNATAAQIAPKK